MPFQLANRDSTKFFYQNTGIFGGYLLGVKTSSGLTLYDWETLDLVRRIEVVPRFDIFYLLLSIHVNLILQHPVQPSITETSFGMKREIWSV